MRLDDSRAKLRRAQKHFDALEFDIRSFLDAKPYRVVVENPAPDLYIARLDNAPDTPGEDWALQIGDCVHNLRAALDFIAWRLAGSIARDGQTQFPIFDTERLWDANQSRRVGRMLPAAQALLKQMQPFQTHDPAGSSLSAIRVLDDADKHKLLTVVAALPSQFSLTWAGPIDHVAHPPRINVLRDAVLVGDSILATLVLPNSPPITEMKHYLAPDIAFGDGLISTGIRVLVLSSLMNMLMEVKAIIDTFEARPELFPA